MRSRYDTRCLRSPRKLHVRRSRLRRYPMPFGLLGLPMKVFHGSDARNRPLTCHRDWSALESVSPLSLATGFCRMLGTPRIQKRSHSLIRPVNDPLSTVSAVTFHADELARASKLHSAICVNAPSQAPTSSRSLRC